ncbi:Acetate kinase [uncultured Clostridium sp.]|nr:Acetate kinase [uncultured Clostridium sp.]
MNILVINAGSSSIKYQVINMDDESVIAKGQIERIGIPGSKLTHKPGSGEPFVLETDMPDHVAGMQHLLAALTDKKHGVVKSLDDIHAVGHRVLHGGSKFSASVVIDDAVKQAIEEYIPLGPLHNPANLMGIKACEKVMPGTPQVAVFDTAFHQTMPPKAFMYALPYECYTDLKIRRYGFHGTSHRYVSKRVADFLGVPASALKTVTCHLGNGSSISAVDGGKCVDTSMGLTPLEGVPMGTRSGNLDPAIIQFIMQRTGKSIDEVNNMLNKESGLLGLTGVTSDMRDVTAAANDGNERAQLAIDMLVYAIKKYIGGYAAAMNGLDCLVFTAGIGENMAHIRRRVCADMDFLGIKLDEAKNEHRGGDFVISADDSKVKVVVIETNEELAIARETLDLVK